MMARTHIESGRTLGAALCEALGINPTNVRRIVVDCSANGVALVEVTCYVETDQEPGVKEVLAKYRLVPNEEQEAAESEP